MGFISSVYLRAVDNDHSASETTTIWGIIKRKLRSDKKVPEKRPGSDGVVSNKEVPFSNQKMGENSVLILKEGYF